MSTCNISLGGALNVQEKVESSAQKLTVTEKDSSSLQRRLSVAKGPIVRTKTVAMHAFLVRRSLSNNIVVLDI